MVTAIATVLMKLTEACARLLQAVGCGAVCLCTEVLVSYGIVIYDCHVCHAFAVYDFNSAKAAGSATVAMEALGTIVVVIGQWN